MVMFGGMIFAMEDGANSSFYMHARFPGDKYKLYYQKLMQTVLGLFVSWWHVPLPC